jgi:hypothetical protein
MPVKHSNKNKSKGSAERNQPSVASATMTVTPSEQTNPPAQPQSTPDSSANNTSMTSNLYDSLMQYLEQKFGEINQQFTATNTRLDGLEEIQRQHEQQFSENEEANATFEKQLHGATRMMKQMCAKMSNASSSQSPIPNTKSIDTTFKQSIPRVESSSRDVRANKPPTYTNEKETSIDTWIMQMDHYLDYGNLDDANKIKIARTYLDKEAAEWYLFTEQSIINYDDFKSRIRQRFKQKDLVKRSMTAITTYKQLGGVQSYVDEFLKLATNVTHKLSMEVIIHHFIQGLKPDIGQWVDMHEFTSLDSAIQSALYTEEKFKGKYGNRGYNNKNNTNNNNKNNYNCNNQHNDDYNSSNKNASINNVYADSQSDDNKSDSDMSEIDEHQEALAKKIRHNVGVMNRFQRIASCQTAVAEDRPTTTLTYKERQQYVKEGRCFDCHERGHRRGDAKCQVYQPNF